MAVQTRQRPAISRSPPLWPERGDTELPGEMGGVIRREWLDFATIRVRHQRSRTARRTA